MDPNSGCWLWTGSLDTWGYGQITKGGGIGTVRAHRLSYEMHSGPIPPGMVICHKCDVPSCVNPHHLFVGTHADNMKDMVTKGRSPVNAGENNPRAKLEPSDIAAIRNSNATRRNLARAFGVSVTHIGYIQRNKSWAA